MAKQKKSPKKTTVKTKKTSSIKSSGKSKKVSQSDLESSIQMSWRQKGYAFLLLSIIAGALSIILIDYSAMPYFAALLFAISIALLAKSYAMES